MTALGKAATSSRQVTQSMQQEFDRLKQSTGSTRVATSCRQVDADVQNSKIQNSFRKVAVGRQLASGITRIRVTYQ